MDITYWFLITLHSLLGAICAIHALLYKRDSVAAFGWIAVVWLGYPFYGPLLYYLFGINRTSRKARRQHGEPAHDLTTGNDTSVPNPAYALSSLNLIHSQFQGLARLGNKLIERPIVNYNTVIGLHNGEEAYPAMLSAIRDAQHSIFLTTYIFETNATGREFIHALVEAHQRQVQVKIIIDGVGEMYSWPHAGTLLQKQGVPVARFDQPKLWPLNISINLRSHRKLLVVDGRTAFVGGMNIGGRHMVTYPHNRCPVIDMQFQLQGPIVQQCVAIFGEDWRYITQQRLILPTPELTHSGNALCRAIEDGPDEYIGNLNTLLVNAVTIAQKSIWIMTPYFLPSLELTHALQAAALRGVEVNILLPQKNNLPYVQWASTHMLPRLLSYGVRIYMQPTLFVHTKLFVVDQYYSLIGSANIDPRSLRLNFELVIEIYDKKVAENLIVHCQACQKNAKAVTLTELAQQSLFCRIRNAIFWLFSPYL